MLSALDSEILSKLENYWEYDIFTPVQYSFENFCEWDNFGAKICVQLMDIMQCPSPHYEHMCWMMLEHARSGGDSKVCSSFSLAFQSF